MLELIRSVINPINEETKPTTNKTNTIKVVILLATLKKDANYSNTYYLCELLKKALPTNVTVQYFYLANMNIDVGLERLSKGNSNDEMHKIYEAVKESDVLIMATPIWWGHPSSLVQKVIERFDAWDDYFIESGKNLLEGKTFGCIVTGAEDGAINCISRMTSWASMIGFTIPPRNFLYWVGEVGVGGDKNDYEKSKPVKEMIDTMVKNMLRDR